MAQVRRALAVGAVGPLTQWLGELSLLQGCAPLLPGCVSPFHFADQAGREGVKQALQPQAEELGEL